MIVLHYLIKYLLHNLWLFNLNRFAPIKSIAIIKIKSAKLIPINPKSIELFNLIKPIPLKINAGNSAYKAIPFKVSTQESLATNIFKNTPTNVTKIRGINELKINVNTIRIIQ